MLPLTLDPYFARKIGIAPISPSLLFLGPDEGILLFGTTYGIFMEWMRGIEPPLSAWKAEALPLNYIHIFK